MYIYYVLNFVISVNIFSKTLQSMPPPPLPNQMISLAQTISVLLSIHGVRFGRTNRSKPDHSTILRSERIEKSLPESGPALVSEGVIYTVDHLRGGGRGCTLHIKSF